MGTCRQSVFSERTAQSYSNYRVDLNGKLHHLHKSFQYLLLMPLVLQRTTRGPPVDYNGPGRHLHNDSCNLTHHFHRIASIIRLITQSTMRSANELCGNGQNNVISFEYTKTSILMICVRLRKLFFKCEYLKTTDISFKYGSHSALTGQVLFMDIKNYYLAEEKLHGHCIKRTLKK